MPRCHYPGIPAFIIHNCIEMSGRFLYVATVNKKIVHKVFEETAKRFPGRTAIRQAGREISYGDLSRVSDDIAKLLKQVGVKRDVIVGVLLESSIAYVAAIIGVMKAGGVFLPLDMSLPEKRLEYILNKTVPQVLISEKSFEAIGERLELTGFTKNTLKGQTCPVILVDQALAEFSNQPSTLSGTSKGAQSAVHNYSFDVDLSGRWSLHPAGWTDSAVSLPDSDPDPDDSCYIIYTSGSTGAPKAIEGCYKSLSHFVHWEAKEFGLDEQVRVTQMPPITFDASLRDIFVPLITGGMLCIPEKRIRTNIKELVRWMAVSGITLVHCVPSLFRMITKEIEESPTSKDILPELRYILMAGEPLYGKDVTRWMDIVGERVTLVNLYGPSETTLVKTFYPIRQRPASPNAMIPVGHPISNTAILITKGNRLCEPGEIGDIFIKTPFRTKGYYRDPDLTKISFVPNPLTGDSDDIVYKTGDIGRYLADRGIEFIGRLDTQVKVNGIRIELGEIESTLLGSDFIDQTVVVSYQSQENENTLVCYYTEKKATDAGEISTWLRLTLPSYMVPSFYVRLDEFLLNINGKIDKKALPKPEELIYEGIAYQSPAGEKEETLARIWAEVLHLKKVGVNSPFFQIGGHSLTATRVLSRIYRELGVEISLRDFFANQTIRGLATLLQEDSGSGFAQITPLERQPDYAVSPSQRRLWILDQMEERSVAYSLPGLFMVDGDFDIPSFRRAFLTLIARHESLRTTFFATDAGPRQRVYEMPDSLEEFGIEEIDLSLEDEIMDERHLDSPPEERALQYARDHATIPFDLSTGQLLRVAVITLSCGRHAIFFNMHHIIGDAWSLDILARDLLGIYDAYRKGKENPFSPLRVQYRDYAAWQNARLETDETQKLSLYWRDKLSGSGSSALDLPLDFPRPLLQTYMGKSFFFSLDERLTTGLGALAQKYDASMFMVLLSLMKILLHRYTGQKDIIVGSPVACRNHPDLEDQIGFYANTLALRDLIDGEESFVSVLEKVKKTTIDAYDHQQYPFDWLVDELSLARDTGHAPLFDVMLVYRDEEPEDILPATDRGRLRPKDILAAKISSGEFESGTSRFDLTFIVGKSGSRGASSLRIEINYNTDLFRDATIERMATHFSMLAESILTDASTAINKLDIISPAEKRLLIETFNDTQYPYPADKTIVDIFEEQVAKRPDHIAIVLKDREISYLELHERAHGLARVLVEKYRIKPQEIVGLMVDRNEWSIVGLMGIMIAGGVYLPVDPFYPLNRIDYMLSDSGCRLLLTEKKNIENNAQVSSSVMNVDIDTLASACDLFADKPLSHRLSPDDLAYIIYTSGSTGLPKGVMIEHSSFLNMSFHQMRTFWVSDSDRVLQFSSASFDAALWEVFMALLVGAAIVVVRKETIDDPLLFVRYLEEKRVTFVTLPPAYLNTLDKEKLNTVTTIITAGEAPNTGDAVFLSGRKNYFNAYGPTEISVCATIERVSPDGDYRRNIPIGKPISNAAIYILDDSLNLVPIGIPGEICISGAGLARGYLNRPELTLEKFVRHPFRVGERLYRTGDIGRWLSDGTLEWLGRNDDQVKIRGYRIELGEIRNAMLRHASVKDAIVIAGGQDVEPASSRHGTEELTAYFTARERLEPADLRSHLGRFLPNHMTPRYLVQLEDIPMTAHGKVDRKTLADHRSKISFDQKSDDAPVSPRSDLEKWMLYLWRELLGNQDIGIHDNFFDSGGNSLRSLQLISRISTGLANLPNFIHFSGKVPVKMLFLNPTVAGLSAGIEKLTATAIERRVKGAGIRGLKVRKSERAEDGNISSSTLLNFRSSALLQPFPQSVTIVREPLIAIFDAGGIGPVDAAAIICLPDEFVDQTGLGKDDIIKGFCQDHPVLSSITSTFMGRVAAIALPCFASEIFSDKAALKNHLAEALEIAGHIGADTVSLTGNLPMATDLGLDLVPSFSSRTGPAFTTGQATVAAAMVMTIEKMLKLSDRRLDQETIGLIGLNTTGAATLFLMLARMPHPKRIILADAYNNLLFASVLSQELSDCGFKGAIEIMRVSDELPSGFYEASLLIGATNVQDIIEVSRVEPGTIIVEESGQRCFSREDALQRLDMDGDILFTEGGLLHLPFASTCQLYLPAEVETILRRTETISLMAFEPREITGCALSGLLIHSYSDLEPTIGEVDGETCLQHYEHLHSLQFGVADPFAIREDSIQRFRERFGVRK